MKKRLTNSTNLPVSTAVWLAADNYDFKFNEKALSATDLGKSVRAIILRNRMVASGATVVVEEDIVHRFPARLGHAVHDAIENVWTNEKIRNIALEQLGVPKSVRDRIQVNPTPEFIERNPNTIPVYMEQRTNKEIMGYIISGQFDFLMMGQLEDFKSTSTFVWEKRVSDTKFGLQGSIYKWLNPEKITKDTTTINYLLKDWSENKALANPKYPQAPVMAEPIKLMTVQETENYIRNKLTAIEANKNTPEPELPLCTPEELWQSPTEYKYFAKPDSARASKVFGTDVSAAYQHLSDKGGKGLIKEIQGEVKACTYCDAKDICTQRQQLQDAGLFKPKR